MFRDHWIIIRSTPCGIYLDVLASRWLRYQANGSKHRSLKSSGPLFECYICLSATYQTRWSNHVGQSLESSQISNFTRINPSHNLIICQNVLFHSISGDRSARQGCRTSKDHRQDPDSNPRSSFLTFTQHFHCIYLKDVSYHYS